MYRLSKTRTLPYYKIYASDMPTLASSDDLDVSGWSDLPFPELIPKFDFELEELEQRWEQLNGPFPLSNPNVPQTSFYRRGWYRVYFKLASRWHIRTLQQSISIANRLVFSPLGRSVAGADESKMVAARIQQLSEAKPWTIILETEQRKDLVARVEHLQPMNIFLGFGVSVVDEKNIGQKLTYRSYITPQSPCSMPSAIRLERMCWSASDASCSSVSSLLAPSTKASNSSLRI